MGPKRKPGIICGNSSPLEAHRGTLHLTEPSVPSHHHGRHSMASHHGGKLTGKVAGVKPDIIQYLTEVAKFFGTGINIHSGLRTPEDQARAMFHGWTTNLCRGLVYVALREEKVKGKHQPHVQPEKGEDRCVYLNRRFKYNEKGQRMDNYYKTAVETPGETPATKAEAKARFWEEAKQVKSLHLTGDAVDLPSSSITKTMRAVLEMHLKHVPEGGATCYHLQRMDNKLLPVVDDALRARWQRLRDASATLHTTHLYPSAPYCGPDDVANYC